MRHHVAGLLDLGFASLAGCGGGDETVRPDENCTETVSSYVYMDGTLPTTRCREGQEECAPRGDGMVECKCNVPCR